MKGLLIKSPWVEEILAKRKTWELRSSNTKVRGLIALIRSGSGLVVGTCELVDCIGPLSKRQLLANLEKHRVSRTDILARAKGSPAYAWVLAKPRKLKCPIPYIHPLGAVIWVNLQDVVVKAVGAA